MKKLIILPLIFTLSFSFSQTLNKTQQKKLEFADIDFEIGDYKRALEAYLELIEVVKEDGKIQLNIGICYYNLRNNDKAIVYLEKARDIGEIEAYFHLANAYHIEERLDEEIELYQYYKNYNGTTNQSKETVDQYISQAEYAKEMIDKPINVDIENFGSSINTEFNEYVPLIYGEEDEIIFTSRRPGSTGGKIDHRGEYYEDVYKCEKKYGFWQQPEQLQGDVNTETHDACVGLSPDGQYLYIFRTSENLIEGDLYRTERGENGWESLERLPDVINSDAIETSASITSDDRVIYFSSSREGGYGGMDIYKVVKIPNGEWSEAENLGPTINTGHDEESPFIHADGKTLYFSSRGHSSMGGFDVFKSTLQASGLWSEPVNMGYPLNSVANDLHFVMSVDKQTGYYSSAAKGGFGGQDIYKINFKLEAQLLSVVKGGVKSNDTTHIPIMATITLIDNRTKAIQGIYKSNPSTGKFIMVLSPESSYRAIVEADGYHTLSTELYYDAILGFGSMIEEFKLVPIQVASE